MPECPLTFFGTALQYLQPSVHSLGYKLAYSWVPDLISETFMETILLLLLNRRLTCFFVVRKVFDR